MAAQQEDAQLQDVQFLKNQAAARGGRLGGIVRGVDGPHRFGLARHAIFCEQLGRQRVGQIGGCLQRRRHAAGNAAGGQPLGGCIDRQQRAGRDLCLGPHKRVQHLTPGQHAADPALEIIGLAGAQVLRRIGSVEPGKRQRTGIISRQHAGQYTAALDAAVAFALQHGGFYTAVDVKRRRRDGIRLRIVDIAARVVQKQVPHGADAELFKLFGKRGPHALEILDRTVQRRQWKPLPSLLF